MLPPCTPATNCSVTRLAVSLRRDYALCSYIFVITWSRLPRVCNIPALQTHGRWRGGPWGLRFLEALAGYHAPGALEALGCMGVEELAASPALSPLHGVQAPLGGPGVAGLASSSAGLCSGFWCGGARRRTPVPMASLRPALWRPRPNILLCVRRGLLLANFMTSAVSAQRKTWLALPSPCRTSLRGQSRSTTRPIIVARWLCSPTFQRRLKMRARATMATSHATRLTRDTSTAAAQMTRRWTMAVAPPLLDPPWVGGGATTWMPCWLTTHSTTSLLFKTGFACDSTHNTQQMTNKNRDLETESAKGAHSVKYYLIFNIGQLLLLHREGESPP